MRSRFAGSAAISYRAARERAASRNAGCVVTSRTSSPFRNARRPSALMARRYSLPVRSVAVRVAGFCRNPARCAARLGCGFARRLGRRLARRRLARVPALLGHALLEERDAQGLALLLVFHAAGTLEGGPMARRQILSQHELLLAGRDAALRECRIAPEVVALRRRGRRHAKEKNEADAARHRRG